MRVGLLPHKVPPKPWVVALDTTSEGDEVSWSPLLPQWPLQLTRSEGKDTAGPSTPCPWAFFPYPQSSTT